MSFPFLNILFMILSSSGPIEPSSPTAFFVRSTTCSVESLHLVDSARKKVFKLGDRG